MAEATDLILCLFNIALFQDEPFRQLHAACIVFSQSLSLFSFVLQSFSPAL